MSNELYTEKFLTKLQEAFKDVPIVIEKVKSHDCMAGRWIDDNSSSMISLSKLARIQSNEELKELIRIERLKAEVYNDYMSGKCYESKSDQRRGAGCPRLYGQITGNYKIMDEFVCPVFGYIPHCPKYGNEECWERFDELGFKIGD